MPVHVGAVNTARFPGSAIGARCRPQPVVQRSTECHSLLTETSNNPAFRYGNFDAARRSRGDGWGRAPEGMTMNGAVGKTAILLAIVVFSAGYVWQQAAVVAAAKGSALVVAGLSQTWGMCGIGALIMSVAGTMKPTWSPWAAPLYAALKGAFLGAISLQYEAMFPGLVQSTVLITLGTAGALLASYQSGLIVVSDRLRNMIWTAFGGIAFAWLGTMLLRLVGVNLAFMSTGTTGMIVAGVSALVAAGVLLTDFDMVKQLEYAGYPKYMEWYGGLAIMIALAWLYTEVLRFLAIFASSQRDN